MAWQTAKTAKLFRMKGKMVTLLVLEFCLKDIYYKDLQGTGRKEKEKKKPQKSD